MQISSINIDNILSGNHDDRILELQSLLDPVTFCLFSAADVRNNTVDAGSILQWIVHIVHILLLLTFSGKTCILHAAIIGIPASLSRKSI